MKSDSESGIVTAELAINLIALTTVFVFLAGGLAWSFAQFSAVDAARSAARLAARGESESAITNTTREKHPRVNLSFTKDEDLVFVEASILHGTLTGFAQSWLPDIRATAVADVEGWGAPEWQSNEAQ